MTLTLFQFQIFNIALGFVLGSTVTLFFWRRR